MLRGKSGKFYSLPPQELASCKVGLGGALNFKDKAEISIWLQKKE